MHRAVRKQSARTAVDSCEHDSLPESVWKRKSGSNCCSGYSGNFVQYSSGSSVL